MSRASNPPASRAGTHTRSHNRRNHSQANTMDEPGGPETVPPDRKDDATRDEDISRTSDESTRREGKHPDDVDPDFKPPLAR